LAGPSKNPFAVAIVILTRGGVTGALVDLSGIEPLSDNKAYDFIQQYFWAGFPLLGLPASPSVPNLRITDGVLGV
jgi:hypothetical protein